ncbi:hypothetical protein [Dermatophilus congolensis]|uniref:hypothetical protein n=1 Tax=Dermatophilus congolensis TaxID=1863 RepID=UPI00312C6D95
MNVVKTTGFLVELPLVDEPEAQAVRNTAALVAAAAAITHRGAFLVGLLLWCRRMCVPFAIASLMCALRRLCVSWRRGLDV